MKTTHLNYRPWKKILQFRLDKDSHSIRQNFLESVVRMALFLGEEKTGKKWMTVSEIHDIILSEYAKKFPKQVVQNFLRSSVEIGKVLLEDGRYTLSKQAKARIIQDIQDRKKLEKDAFDKLTQPLNENDELTSEQKRNIRDDFRFFLAQLFTAKGAEAATILVGTRGKPITQELTKILEKTLEELGDGQLTKMKDFILELVLHPNEKVTSFLWMTLLKYVYFEVLDLDPECRALERKAFAGKTVFIDTNLIYDLLFETQARHSLAKETIKACNELNINVVFTQKTKTEFLSTLRRSAERYAEWKSRVSESTIKKLIKFEGGIIKNYFHDKKDNPSLTFEGYFASLRKGFQKRLREQFGIEYDPHPYAYVEKRTEFASLCELVSVCGKQFMQIKDQDRICHDAYHLVLVKELRKTQKESLFGPDYWFITNDDSMYCISKILMKERKMQSPLSVRSDVWLQAISAFIPSHTIGEESLSIAQLFYRFCGSPAVRSLPKLDHGKLIEISGPWMDYDWLTAEDIMEIASERFVNDSINNPQDVPEKMSIAESISPLISAKAEEKIEQLLAEREGLMLEKAKLEKILAETKVKPNKFLLALGIFSFISIILLALFAGYQKIGFPDILYICLTMLTIVFIASSVFGKKIFETISLKIPGK